MPYKAGGTADIDIPSRNVFMTFRDFFGFRGDGMGWGGEIPEGRRRQSFVTIACSIASSQLNFKNY